MISRSNNQARTGNGHAIDYMSPWIEIFRRICMISGRHKSQTFSVSSHVPLSMMH